MARTTRAAIATCGRIVYPVRRAIDLIAGLSFGWAIARCRVRPDLRNGMTEYLSTILGFTSARISGGIDARSAAEALGAEDWTESARRKSFSDSAPTSRSAVPKLT